MKVWRELDVLVAEMVIGRKIIPYKTAPWRDPILYIDERAPGGILRFLPNYSTDITDAWEVVEKVGQNFVRLYIENGKWNAWIRNSHENSTAMESAETAPLAICLAALKAVEVSISETKGGHMVVEMKKSGGQW